MTGGRFALGLGRGFDMLFDALGIPRVTMAQLEDFTGIYAPALERRGRSSATRARPARSRSSPSTREFDERHPGACCARSASSTLEFAGRVMDGVDPAHVLHRRGAGRGRSPRSGGAPSRPAATPTPVRIWSVLATVGDHIDEELRLRKLVGRLATYLQGYGDLLVSRQRLGSRGARRVPGRRGGRVGRRAPSTPRPTGPSSSTSPACCPTSGSPRRPPGRAEQCAATVLGQFDLGADRRDHARRHADRARARRRRLPGHPPGRPLRRSRSQPRPLSAAGLVSGLLDRAGVGPAVGQVEPLDRRPAAQAALPSVDVEPLVGGQPGCGRAGAAARRHRLGSTVTMRPSLTPIVSRATASSQRSSSTSGSRSAARHPGVDAVAEAELAAVDVAHAGDHGLVEQQRTDGPGARAGPGDEALGVGVGAAAGRGRAGRGGGRSRPRRSARTPSGRTGPRCQPAPSSRRRIVSLGGSVAGRARAAACRTGRGARAAAPRVSPARCRSGSARNRCLPTASVDATVDAVDHGGALGEPALGRGGAHRSAGEVAPQVPGQAVDGVALGHPVRPTKRCGARRAGWR